MPSYLINNVCVHGVWVHGVCDLGTHEAYLPSWGPGNASNQYVANVFLCIDHASY